MGDKKLYFMSVDKLNDEETYMELTDEEFKKRAEFRYDSIEDFIDDFNREVCPSDIEYFCRLC